MITEFHTIFDSDSKREFTCIKTTLVIVKELIRMAGIFAVILIIPIDLCERKRTCSQASAIPIKMPSRITRIVTEVSSPFISVLMRSATICHTRPIKVKSFVFLAFVGTEVFTSS